MPLEKIDEFGADLSAVQEAIRTGITSKCANALDSRWERWDEFCSEHGLDPFLRQHTDPVPILQVFGQRHRDGRNTPRGKPVKARTVEDALRAVGQKFASVGAADLRKDAHGTIDFRIYRQIRSYKKTDSPPVRVKPVPITLVIYLLRVAHHITGDEAQQAIADMITIAFYYLLRPGEYTGTTSDDTAFAIKDVTLHLGKRALDWATASLAEIEAATSASYTFTTQKNGVRNKIIAYGRSHHPLCCPVTATICRILYHRRHNTPPEAPLASYYRNNCHIAIKAQDVTDSLRHSATTNFHVTGIKASVISARSLRAGGAMALLCGNVDFDLIKMLGHWHSDAMMRCLHLQAQPNMKRFAVAMFNDGQCTFLPEDTVPVNPQE